MLKTWVSAMVLAAAVVGLAAASRAQQAPPGQRPAPPPAAAGAPADATLQRRVEQLEEQLVDMQVVIGTLESLAKGGAAPGGGGAVPGGSGALSAADAGRLDALETQIRALAAQLDSLQEQVRSLGGDRRGGPGAGGFGAVTVAPEAAKDDLDRVFPPTGSGATPARPAPAPPGNLAGTPAGKLAEAEQPPQQLYERAYGLLLQKDYGTAEASFEDFLKRHPGHPLAGNAQYWLGETFYVRGQYRPAAAAFLKGYQDYAKSQKAPETLLKLAMSLQRLGQKDAACSSYNEFTTRFPNPPAHIKGLAQTERQRSGC